MYASKYFVALVIFFLFSCGEATCPFNYTLLNGYCIGSPTSTALDFVNASHECFKTGYGVLAGASSLQEMSIIAGFLRSHCNICNFWLGWTNYKHEHTNGRFYWMDFKSDPNFLVGQGYPAIDDTNTFAAELVFSGARGMSSLQLTTMSSTARPLCSFPAPANIGSSKCNLSSDWIRLTPTTMYHYNSTLKPGYAAHQSYCASKGGRPFSISSMAEIIFAWHISTFYGNTNNPIYVGMEKIGDCINTTEGSVRGYGESFKLYKQNSCSSLNCTVEPRFRLHPQHSRRMWFQWRDCTSCNSTHMVTLCENVLNSCPEQGSTTASRNTIPEPLELPCTQYSGLYGPGLTTTKAPRDNTEYAIPVASATFAAVVGTTGLVVMAGLFLCCFLADLSNLRASLKYCFRNIGSLCRKRRRKKKKQEKL